MRILVAVDYADCSRVACDWAIERIAALGVREVVFQHVVDKSDGASELRDLEQATQNVRAFVAAAIGDRTLPSDLVVRYAVSTGSAKDALLAAAQQHKVDAIVMGTHGRTGLDRLRFGSVAEAVVRGAPCTVVVVKPGPAS